SGAGFGLGRGNQHRRVRNRCEPRLWRTEEWNAHREHRSRARGSVMAKLEWPRLATLLLVACSPASSADAGDAGEDGASIVDAGEHPEASSQDAEAGLPDRATLLRMLAPDPLPKARTDVSNRYAN